MENIRMYELSPRYDSRKSFYCKAHVIETENGVYLRSYDTVVCGIENGVFKRFWSGWSATTSRHVNEFTRQQLGYTVNKSEWFNIPCEVYR